MSPAQVSLLNRDQQRVIVILWATYALYYLGRLNLSPALTAIAASLTLSRAEVGVLGTAFFWAYALGQLINGQLGNRFSPRRIIALGLGVVALSNLLFGLQTALPVMLILWAVNGYAQSTGWGPMLRILAERLTLEQSKRMSVIFSISYQVGTALSWLVATLLVQAAGWRSAFLVPGAALLVILALWWSSGVDAPQTTSFPAAFRWSDLWQDTRHAWPVLLGSIFMGIIYAGALIWLPTYLAETGVLPPGLISLMTAVMPLVGAGGMLLASYLLRRRPDPLRLMRAYLLVMTLSMMAAVLSTTAVQLLCVTLLMFAMGGSAALLMGSIPLMIAGSGRASSAAGTITAVHNIGGGVAGVVVGGMIDRAGWNGVFALWAVCGLVAFSLTFFVLKSTPPQGV